MSIWTEMQDRGTGDIVKKEDQHLVKVEWDVRATCKEYCTAWITYTIGSESIRKRARLYSDYYSGIWVTNKDFWAVLRFMIGENLKRERKSGYITMKRLMKIIKETDHFHSETWDKMLRDFAWQNNYEKDNHQHWINVFMDKVGGEYKEGSSLVGLF